MFAFFLFFTSHFLAILWVPPEWERIREERQEQESSSLTNVIVIVIGPSGFSNSLFQEGPLRHPFPITGDLLHLHFPSWDNAFFPRLLIVLLSTLVLQSTTVGITLSLLGKVPLAGLYLAHKDLLRCCPVHSGHTGHSRTVSSLPCTRPKSSSFSL